MKRQKCGGGLTKVGPGTLQYAVPGNTVGGALADDPTQRWAMAASEARASSPALHCFTKSPDDDPGLRREGD
jgi:hypothetical protein